MPLRYKLRYLLRHALLRLGLPLVPTLRGDDREGLAYLSSQGPTMDGLMLHLRQHSGDYAALIFVTARFHPAAIGVLIDPARSILVPNLHDEKSMYLPHFHRVFRAPRWIMYNTRAEAATAERLYGKDLAPGEVCGIGLRRHAAAPLAPADADRIWQQTALRLQVRGPYLLYVGRVDTSKGCDELFTYFGRLRRELSEPLQLIVCGQLFMPAPTGANIVLAGFVSDADRDALIAHALALVIPSRHESLSLVLLESLAAGCPVIVNRHSDVLHQHVQDSGVGAAYVSQAEFSAAVAALLTQDEATRQTQAMQGQRYVQEHYDWSVIVAKYRRVIEQMSAP